MEPENTTAPEAKPRKRFTGSRVLLGIVGACLLLWSIKAIQHAMQPKYQGKTAAEWFADAKRADELCELNPEDLRRDPTVEAFRHLGTNGVWFLRREHIRKPSKTAALLVGLWEEYVSKKRQYFHYGVRQKIQARQLLIGLGPQSDPLIPLLVDQLASPDQDESVDALILLAHLHRRADIVVPALVKQLQQAHQKTHYLWGLSEFGPEASAAVPALRELLARPKISPEEKAEIAYAILKINGAGPELEFITAHIKYADYENSSLAIERLGQLGPIAETATPALISFARTLTNSIYSNRVMHIIHKIDPAGIHPKP